VRRLDLRSASADETRAIAAALARVLEPGDVVVLAGELGGGKTTFVQGAARALGSTARVTSPTFTIVQEYDGATPIAHVDLYRLDHVQELHDIGFDELVDAPEPDRRVVFVEWGERAANLLPADSIVVRLASDAQDADVRAITVELGGLAWARRVDAVTAALRPWTVS
jgi:tRNA threonylcarbamoyladenosine biosynthesis protein TsaE